MCGASDHSALDCREIRVGGLGNKGSKKMLNYRSSLVIGPFLAALLLLFPMQSWSGELPEGVRIQVLDEYSVDIPGVRKAQLSVCPQSS